METAMGQFSRTSPLQLWECAPIARGVGFAMIVLSLIVSIYYNVIMSYSLIYIGASIRGIWEDLPWSYCGEWWGANDNCVVLRGCPKMTSLFLPSLLSHGLLLYF